MGRFLKVCNQQETTKKPISSFARRVLPTNPLKLCSLGLSKNLPSQKGFYRPTNLPSQEGFEPHLQTSFPNHWVRGLTQKIAETDDFLPFWYRGTRDDFLSAGAQDSGTREENPNRSGSETPKNPLKKIILRKNPIIQKSLDYKKILRGIRCRRRG